MLTGYVALLRGINVGGKNRLPMKDLRAIFGEAGCADVQTYIQSGNVVFRAEPRVAERLPERITARIAAQFGYRTPVVLRTAAELREVVAKNPFLLAGAPEATLHVMFLADTPSPERVAALDLDRSPPDQFTVQGQEIYLHLPRGVAESKLTNSYFDSALAAVSTSRNWRTVITLLGMAEAASQENADG